MNEFHSHLREWLKRTLVSDSNKRHEEFYWKNSKPCRVFRWLEKNAGPGRTVYIHFRFPKNRVGLNDFVHQQIVPIMFFCDSNSFKVSLVTDLDPIYLGGSCINNPMKEIMRIEFRHNECPSKWSTCKEVFDNENLRDL